MKLEEKTIKSAFQRRDEKYGKDKYWDLRHHVDMWEWAKEAFTSNSFENFQHVYDALRGKWYVFRPMKNPWSAKKTFDKLQSLDKSLMGTKLSNLEQNLLTDAWKLALSIVEIKPNKDGPSMVAISKFLHFWNPGLFVIVDREVVWNHVFKKNHRLWQHLESVYEDVDKSLPLSITQSRDYQDCDFGYYPAILWFCSKLIKENPSIITHFRELILSQVKNAEMKISLQDHEAAAVEWLLTGLVELPDWMEDGVRARHMRR